MDEEQQALNTDVQAENVEATPAPETNAQETEADQPQETEVEVGKRSAQARIRELATEKKQLKGEVETLTERINKLTDTGFNPDQYGNPPPSDIQSREEITPEEVYQEASRRGATAAYLVSQQQKAVDRIRSETIDIEKEYPALDPQSESYDRDLSAAITTAVESQVKVLTGYDPQGQPIYAINPNASPKAIVKTLMKPYRKSIDGAVAEETTKAVAQAAQTAMRPTPTVPHFEKDPKDMTKEELEKKLGIVY